MTGLNSTHCLRNSRFMLILSLAILISGCELVPATSSPSASPSYSLHTPAVEQTLLPNASPALRYTATPPATFTTTPLLTQTPTLPVLYLPGMAGFLPTPTYDPMSTPPATPALPPPCPAVNPELGLGSLTISSLANYGDRYPPPDLSDPVVRFLNMGGSPDTFIQVVQQVNPELALLSDLTNDGQPELILNTGVLSILGCSPSGSKEFEVLGQFVDDIDLVPPEILAIQDLNLDSFPELLLTSRAFGGLSTTYLLQVRAWDGQAFSSVPVLPPSYPYRSQAELDFLDFQGELWGITYHAGRVELGDVDQNGTTEFIIHSGIPGHPNLAASGTWRRATDVFTWNGKAFVLLHSEIEPAVYRFQAAHDADQAVLLGDYERALLLYQEVISSDRLAGWSPELYDQLLELVEAYAIGLPTPTPLPASAEETSHLTAYAYFRTLVLHALQGDEQEAQIVYDALIEQFPAGQPGYASAELATAFWQAYLSTHEVGQACTQALDAIGDSTEDILYWLDGNFHGRQAPRYSPLDLCPFGQRLVGDT